MAEVGCLKDGCFQNLQVNGVQYPGKVPIVNLGDARTVLPEESGTVFTLESSAAGFIVTLPNVDLARGCRFRFITTEDTPTNDITIKSNAANIVGIIQLFVVDDADTTNAGSARTVSALKVTGHTNVLFDTTALIGDWIELVSDGTKYFVCGAGSAAGAFTIT